MTASSSATAVTKKWTFEPVNCVYCHVDDTTPYYETNIHEEGKLTFVRCNKCGLIYQNPCPTPESLDSIFNSAEFASAKEANVDYEKVLGYWDYIGDECFRLPMARDRLKRLTKLTGGRKLSILKIACATGTFLHVAKQAGHEVLGVDLSKFFCDYAREKYDINVINNWFEKVDFGDKKFDVIIMWGASGNVHDPEEFYGKINHLLTDDGYFLMNDIAVDSWIVKLQGSRNFGFRPPGLQYFPKKVMIALLDRCGFEVVADEWDYQYTNLAKLFLFLRIKFLWKMLQFLPLEKIIIKMPVPGNYFLICRKKRSR